MVVHVLTTEHLERHVERAVGVIQLLLLFASRLRRHNSMIDHGVVEVFLDLPALILLNAHANAVVGSDGLPLSPLLSQHHVALLELQHRHASHQVSLDFVVVVVSHLHVFIHQSHLAFDVVGQVHPAGTLRHRVDE